jgi:MFS transporter, SP family, arabinose:H+ symporter
MRTNETGDEGNALYMYGITIVAAVGGLLFGFDIGVISGTIPFITSHFGLNVHQEGFVVSNLLIGSMVGAGIAGILGDRFGRKRILILAALLFVISAVGSAIPRTLWELISARFLGGIAVGIASVLSPVYIAEIAPAKIRGRLVGINQFTIVIGIMLTYISNWLLVDIGPHNWRWMFGVEAIPAAVFMIALMAIPESPRWLLKQGDRLGAGAILAKIGGKRNAEIQLKEITETLSHEQGTLGELFKPGMRRALVVGILLAVFSQITGMNTVIYYAPKIFMMAGYENASSALLANILVGVTNFVATIIALAAIDRFGRKSLLYVGLTGMIVSFGITGSIFQSATISGSWIIAPILGFVAFFSMSLGPVTWVMLSELFPTKIRGRAMSIATMSLWLSCFGLSQTFPWLIDRIGGRSFHLFAVICIAALVFVATMIRETKGKSLEEIERMWEAQ